MRVPARQRSARTGGRRSLGVLAIALAILAMAAASSALAAGPAADDNPSTQARTTKPGPPAITLGEGATGSTGIPRELVARQRSPRNGLYDIRVTTRITVAESGTLRLSVLGGDRQPVLLNGAQTSVDSNLVGAAQAAAYRYRVVRPRPLDLELSIPYSQVEPGEQLTLQLAYTDEDASRKTTRLSIPVQAPATLALPQITRVLQLTDRQVAAIAREIARDGSATVTATAASPGSTTVTIRWAGLASTTGSLRRVVRSTRALDVTAGVTADGRGITGRFTVAD